jgi:hypothetical protein
MPLLAQQADFIQRLKLGHVLHCGTKGQHSELTTISSKKTEKLRYFCWEMAEKYKKNQPVRRVFINNMKGKLGEEVIKARLDNLITPVDYEKRPKGDDKIDFYLTSAPTIGIQARARHGNIDSVRWSINQEEINKNAALICILIQEEVNEAQHEYHLILAGFLPTPMIKREKVGIHQLLYGGALRSYLEFLGSSLS